MVINILKNAHYISLKDLVNISLDKYVTKGHPQKLFESMRYSLLGSGKRIRAVMCLEACKAFGGDVNLAIPIACAIEIVHAQTLIHDDLPCMDDDDYRRGKPSCHKQYNEATAVLAGDAMLPFSFEVFLKHTPKSVADSVKLNILTLFVSVLGPTCLVGGQFVDIENEGKPIDAQTLDYIHSNKTAGLFRFSLVSGAMLAGATESQISSIEKYADDIGLAFQISDDILDIVATKEQLGKTPGKDAKVGKNTYPSIYGLHNSIKELENVCMNAQQILKENNIDSELLINIPSFLKERVK